MANGDVLSRDGSYQLLICELFLFQAKKETTKHSGGQFSVNKIDFHKLHPGQQRI